MPSLAIKNMVKKYGEFIAINNVSFNVEHGEFVVLVGPSGCGKSTLLRSIAGLESISEGEILINDTDIAHREPYDRGVAMVFQNYALYPHMTVRQNMGFALKVARMPKAEINAAVERAAKTLRITEQLDKRPKALSGGQKQRVAIGRAITRSPDVFLFDEPLSNLDAALRSQMRVELGRLHTELDATMVYVTHDQTEAMTMASRIVVLRDGVVEQIGTPLSLYNRPICRFVAGFLGSPKMNFIQGNVESVTNGIANIRTPCLPNPLPVKLNVNAAVPSKGENITVGIRPEAFDEEDHNGWPMSCKVAITESLGRDTLLYVDAGKLRAYESESHEGYFAVHRNRQIDTTQGDQLKLTINSAKVYLFDAQDRAVAWPQEHISTLSS